MKRKRANKREPNAIKVSTDGNIQQSVKVTKSDDCKDVIIDHIGDQFGLQSNEHNNNRKRIMSDDATRFDVQDSNFGWADFINGVGGRGGGRGNRSVPETTRGHVGNKGWKEEGWKERGEAEDGRGGILLEQNEAEAHGQSTESGWGDYGLKGAVTIMLIKNF